jgi:outer membrane biosynthesis protein TonB
MRIARATAIGVLLVSVLALGGCIRKKKPAVPPPQAEAPTVTQPQPETPPPPPPVASEPNRPEPEAAKPETATAPAPAPAPKPKKPRHVTTAKKPAPPPAAVEKPAEKQPSRTVVNEGGTQPATPQLSASLSPDAAIHQKFNTAQLLEATDSNLKSISRTLSSDEQSMVQTIRSFVNQSRQATKDGDTDLAYRLALKAHLLSDELVKR